MGSVKTNIGHLEGAAGIAGLIKAALCLRHGQLAPSLNFRNPNPRIPLEDLLKSAEAGNGTAQFYLARRYALGDNAPKDDALALSWATKAAAQDVPEAQDLMGMFYLGGLGLPAD